MYRIVWIMYGTTFINLIFQEEATIEFKFDVHQSSRSQSAISCQ